jgi:hypothetical protein
VAHFHARCLDFRLLTPLTQELLVDARLYLLAIRLKYARNAEAAATELENFHGDLTKLVLWIWGASTCSSSGVLRMSIYRLAR